MRRKEKPAGWQPFCRAILIGLSLAGVTEAILALLAALLSGGGILSDSMISPAVLLTVGIGALVGGFAAAKFYPKLRMQCSGAVGLLLAIIRMMFYVTRETGGWTFLPYFLISVACGIGGGTLSSGKRRR